MAFRLPCPRFQPATPGPGALKTSKLRGRAAPAAQSPAEMKGLDHPAAFSSPEIAVFTRALVITDKRVNACEINKQGFSRAHEGEKTDTARGIGADAAWRFSGNRSSSTNCSHCF